jgi:hypothetical protein
MIWIIALSALALVLMFYIICLLIIGSRADAPRAAHFTGYRKKALFTTRSGDSSNNDVASSSLPVMPESMGR